MLTKLPLAKTENIVIQTAGDDFLIYHLVTEKAFCLNQTSALVFNACDGKTSLDELKEKHQFTEDLILLALDELKRGGLIADDYVSPLKGMKRREVIKKVGLASMIALPVIVSLIAPTSAMAQSCGGTFAMGTVLGCTVTEQSCLNMASMCASCSSSGSIMIGAGACDTPAPFLCVCE